MLDVCCRAGAQGDRQVRLFSQICLCRIFCYVFISILLNLNADINLVAKSGGTALLFAAGGGHFDVTKLLIQAQADVNAVVVATPEYIEQVTAAIKEGKEDVEPHKDGVTALMVAAEGGYEDIVKILVENGAVVDIQDDEGITPLLNAVQSNSPAIAYYLLEHGANPNDSYFDDKDVEHNLLMDAILANNTALGLLLIERGANVTHIDADGVTLTLQAAYLGMLPVVRELVARGADAISANSEGISPLLAACSEGHVEVVRVLVEQGGADVNSKDKDSTTALMASAVRGHKDIVTFLLQRGVDVNAQNNDGHTALMFAFNGKNQIQSLLSKYDGLVKDSDASSVQIIRDALQVHMDVISLLINSGADETIKVIFLRLAPLLLHLVI